MNNIVTKEIRDVRYALGSAETAKNRYNQIKRTFPEGNEYRIFSEPIPLSEGNKIMWTTEYEGTPVNYSKLSPEEQSFAKDKLSEQMKRLFEAAKKFDDTQLLDFLYKCIEIPNLNDIYVIKKDGQNFIVLTQWGFYSDVPGAEKGLLEKIINATRVPMIFDVKFTDERIAPGIEIHFEYEGKKVILKSDQNGMIVLDKVKVDAFVKAYEMEKDQQINHHKFTCYENGRYLIKVMPRYDMKFKVVNQKNTPQPNLTFQFKFLTEENKLTTNAGGEMILENLKLDTEVKVFQVVDGRQENINHFICQKDKQEYLIVIQTPETVVEPPKNYQMKFKVVDDKNQIVSNAEVTLSYKGKTVKLFTDENGYCIINDIEPGTQVKVVAYAEKKKK